VDAAGIHFDEREFVRRTVRERGVLRDFAHFVAVDAATASGRSELVAHTFHAVRSDSTAATVVADYAARTASAGTPPPR